VVEQLLPHLANKCALKDESWVGMCLETGGSEEEGYAADSRDFEGASFCYGRGGILLSLNSEVGMVGLLFEVASKRNEVLLEDED
jgi:hypothetical protein